LTRSIPSIADFGIGPENSPNLRKRLSTRLEDMKRSSVYDLGDPLRFGEPPLGQKKSTSCVLRRAGRGVPYLA
jgi:hypothetical protein